MVVKNPDTTITIAGIAGAFVTLTVAAKAFSTAAEVTGLFGLAKIADKLAFMARFLGIASLWAAVASLSGDTPTDPNMNRPYDPVTNPNMFDRNGAVGKWWTTHAPTWLGGGGAIPPGLPGPVNPPPTGPQAPGVRNHGLTLEQMRMGQDQRRAMALNYFRSKGWNDVQAHALVGYMSEETGGTLSPRAFNPDGGGQGASGAGQWRGPRIDVYRQRYGRNPDQDTFEHQLEYLDWEMRNSEAASGIALGSANTLDDAARAMLMFGRGPANQQGAIYENILKFGQPRPGDMAPTTGRPMNQYTPIPAPGGGSSSNKNFTIGDVHVYTQSTDAHGISKEINAHLSRAITDSNRGLE